MKHPDGIVLRRRLDDRIREMCAEAVDAHDDKFELLLAQLREILRLERERLKQRPKQERRSA